MRKKPDASRSRTFLSSRYLQVLLILFTVEWVALAIHPLDRKDWLLENLLVFLAAAVLTLTRKRLAFSKISYTFMFIFLCVHAVGAHYTYAEVPYDRWFQALTGQSFNQWVGWQRNNFDRVVHFLYGFLLAYPIREVFFRVANARGFWGYFLPLEFTMATSMMYELLEWAVAAVFGGDLGAAYLGAQGDVWDAHKDMFLASLGAFLAMAMTALINVRLRRDFAREWAESLRVKHSQPLGEVAIKRLLK